MGKLDFYGLCLGFSGSRYTKLKKLESDAEISSLINNRTKPAIIPKPKPMPKDMLVYII
jgi:hypothetical protein